MTEVMARLEPRAYGGIIMKLIDELRAEHDLIDKVAASMRTWVNRLLQGDAPVADGRKFMDFFSVYAGARHHGREEQILFPRVWNELALPADSAPVSFLVETHHELSALLDCMKFLLRKDNLSRNELGELETLAIRYTRTLWAHIDSENSVLFPELENRLLHAGVHELAAPPIKREEEDARIAGEALVHVYEPAEDANIVRGEGCAMCPAYMESCRGVEREWWNEWEWEELRERVTS
jgi:hemerythrin-like domain-containing protein